MIQSKQKVEKFANSVRTKQRQQIMKKKRDQINQWQHPLCSKVLEKFLDLSHPQIRSYIPEIEYAIMDNLHFLQNDDQEQQILAGDIFYLIMQHNNFTVPRKIKFIHNGSRLVASLMSIIALNTLPEQLAYWMGFMSDEDKEIVYLAILGEQSYALAWTTHPVLKKYIMIDFLRSESAAKGVRQIVGFKRIDPDRLKTSDGITLAERFSQLLIGQFDSMQIESQKKFRMEHLQTIIWVLNKNWNEPICKDLCLYFNKAIVSRQKQLSKLFFNWICQALKSTPLMLNIASLQIVLQALSHEINIDRTYSTRANNARFVRDLLKKAIIRVQGQENSKIEEQSQ